MTGSFMDSGNQYTQLVKVLYCKLKTIGKLLSTFPHKFWGLNRPPQRLEMSVLPLCHCGPLTGYWYPKPSENCSLTIFQNVLKFSSKLTKEAYSFINQGESMLQC